MTATCKICKQEIVCGIVGDEQKKAFELGQQLLDHMGKYHVKYMKQLAQDTRIFSGFIVMNRFEIDDDAINAQSEAMRERLIELVREDGPMTDEEAKLEAIADILSDEVEEVEEEFEDEDKPDYQVSAFNEVKEDNEN